MAPTKDKRSVAICSHYPFNSRVALLHLSGNGCDKAVVCAVGSCLSYYSSQLGNVGKLTPVQCLTSQSIKLPCTYIKKPLSPISKQQSLQFKQGCFITIIKIQTKLEHT